MAPITIERRRPGVLFCEDGSAEILLWSPEAKNIDLLVLRNEMRIPLEKAELGFWTLRTTALRPGDLYQFMRQGEKDGRLEWQQLNDPASISQPTTVHEPSQAVDLNAFSWQDAGWQNPALERYIIYELHTGTFTAEGNFAGIEAKLDHLLSLGVTAVEIMPVAQFPGDRNWGYDGVYPYAVQNSYGGPEGLQRLVAACHAKGLAVILDVVYNHIGPEGNYLPAYGPYFTEKYHTPWGSALNFDDAWCDGVRHYFVQNVLMWFRDFHIDALRMDAVHAIKDFSGRHLLQEIHEETRRLMEETGRTHHLIVECDLNDTRFLNPVEKGGFGMDAQWIDEFHHALRVTATGQNDGYYSDFSGIAHLAKSYRDAYVYDGQYSPHRQKKFGVPATGHPGWQFIVFAQNHDQVGNRMLGERISQLASFEMQKLMAAAVLLSPFIPMLFMGEEWAEDAPFLYFVSHSDPELAEAVRKGRKAEFAAFHTQGEAPDPMAEATFKDSKLNWHLPEGGRHQAMLRFYQTLIALRKSNPVLQRLSRVNLEARADEAAKTLVLRRWQDAEEMVCLMNFSNEAQRMEGPFNDGNWRLLLNSGAAEFGGSATAPESVTLSEIVSVPPATVLVYTPQHV